MKKNEKTLRDKLKEAQIRCRKLGYSLELLMNDVYLRRINSMIDLESVGNFVKVYVRPLQADYSKFYSKPYTVEFVAIPTNESSLMLQPFDVVNNVNKYWSQLLKECKALNDLNISGTYEEIITCMEDILKKSRV